MPASVFSSPADRRTYIGVVGLTVVIFAAVVGFITLQARQGLRQQVLLREAEALSAVASMQLANEAAALAELGVAEVPDQLLAAVLKASRLRGVLAIRVFDGQRRFAGAVPLTMADDPPGTEWTLQPLARMRPRSHLEALSNGAIVGTGREEGADTSLLEVWVPLRRQEGADVSGVAQFWIDGSGATAEFRRLDARLGFIAAGAWLSGALVMAGALTWAFRRLSAANHALAVRTEDLQRANQELVLAAKTSALGAVTAHLIHEIKNPLAGLEVFVAEQAGGKSDSENGHELAAASALTRKLRRMINDVVGVLRDEQHGTHFELTASEVIELAVGRANASVLPEGIRVVSREAVQATLAGRQANLAGLVLKNLLQNAAEASPRGGVVSISARRDRVGDLEFLVEDQGPGLPAHVRSRLFQPCTSSKEGGSGLGLVLSQQIAQQAGGKIELVFSEATGTCFRLVFPNAS